MAEIKDKSLQQIDTIVKDMLLRDNALNMSPSPKVIESPERQNIKVAPKFMKDEDFETQGERTGAMRYEDLPKDKRKYYKSRAKKKVFGRVGGLQERADRFFKKTYKYNPESSQTKMKFFYS